MTGSRLGGNQYFQGVPTVSFSFPAAALVPSGQAAFNIGIDYRSRYIRCPLRFVPRPSKWTTLAIVVSASAT